MSLLEQGQYLTSFVLLDLDGQVMSFPNRFLPKPGDQIALLREAEKLRTLNTRFLGLTNRPPGQMQPIARNLGEKDGFWVTENGGSVYDVATHGHAVLPEWHRTASEDVPQLRRYLEQAFDIPLIPSFPRTGLQFEPGMGALKTIITVPNGMTVEEAAEKIRLALKQGRFGEQFVVEAGKAVDIGPRGLSKEAGMETLLTINNITPTRAIFIADHKRDIPAAKVLLRRGGRIAAVGNSGHEYREYVARNEGLLAPETTTHEGSVAHILRRFRRIIQQEQHNE